MLNFFRPDLRDTPSHHHSQESVTSRRLSFDTNEFNDSGVISPGEQHTRYQLRPTNPEISYENLDCSDSGKFKNPALDTNHKGPNYTVSFFCPALNFRF